VKGLLVRPFIVSIISKEESKMIEVELPKGFMNCAVTASNHLVADTNDSSNWDTLKFPLPKPAFGWNIHSYKNNNKIVVLVDKD
jgi:hypothetical protein